MRSFLFRKSFWNVALTDSNIIETSTIEEKTYKLKNQWVLKLTSNFQD